MSPPQQLQSDDSVLTIEDSYCEDDDSDIIVISDDESYLNSNVCLKKNLKEEEDNLHASESSTDAGDLSLHKKTEADSLDEKLEKSLRLPQKLQLHESRTRPHNFEEDLYKLKQMKIHHNSSGSAPNASCSSESDDQNSNTLVFNDTLEEMEMALKHGLGYQMPGDDPVPIRSSEPHKFTGIPVLKTRAPSTNTCMTNDIKKKPTTSKLPLKCVKKAITPSVRSKYYKNIISPVRVYIKNSQACLKQSVATKTIPKLCLPARTATLQKGNKENVVFPEAVYKSGRRLVTAVHRDVVLPNSIQKMTPEPVLIHHKPRYQSLKRLQSRKLEKEDITLASDSLDQDISLLTETQAFIK